MMDHSEIRGCGIILLMDELTLGLYQDLQPCVMSNFLWQVTNFWNKTCYSTASYFQSIVPFETMIVIGVITITAAKILSNWVQVLWPWSRNFTSSFRDTLSLPQAIFFLFFLIFFFFLHYYFYIASSYFSILVYNPIIQYCIYWKILLLVSCNVWIIYSLKIPKQHLFLSLSIHGILFFKQYFFFRDFQLFYLHFLSVTVHP